MSVKMRSLEAVEADLSKVEVDIEAVGGQIKEAEGKIEDAEAAGIRSNVQRWVRKEEQLREKEKQLRENKNKLLDERARLQAAATLTGYPSPGISQSAPQELTDFWKALPRADWSDDGKVMSLADGTSFLGSEELGDTLYYRDCYDGLEREVNTLFAQRKSSGQIKYRAVAVIGNPGIGKSLFGYLLLHRWACEGRRVVVVKESFCEVPTLLTADGAIELDRAALRDELQNPEVRYLVDSLNPGRFGLQSMKAQMVLVTSPDKNVYSEVWKTSGYARRYMDVWTWDEMEKCRVAIYSHQPRQEVEARYDRWGGIPRYVFERLDETEQALLEAAMGSTNLAELQRAAGKADSPSEASHKLLHLRASPNFQTIWMEMASLYVAGKIAYTIWHNKKEDLRLFLDASAGEKGPEAFRGNLWEGFCHERLANGGEFRVRDVRSSDKQKKMLPASTPFVFDDWKEVRKRPDGQYLRPRSRINEAVDSGMQPSTLYQITVSKRHDLKCAGLKRAVESMKQSGAVELFFAVPPDSFEQFRGVEISTGTGVAAVRSAVKQFALEVGF